MATAASSLSRALRLLPTKRPLFTPSFLHASASSSDLEKGDREGFSRSPRDGVHSTALVHPHAILGEEVIVGPFLYCWGWCKDRKCNHIASWSHIFGDTELGEHCVIMTGAVVGADIPGKTVIGRNNSIGHHSVVGVKCQDNKYKPGDPCFLYVGNDNDIREYVSIHRSFKSDDKTVIGDGNLIMGSCHVAHDCKVGNNNIFANSTLLAGHVVVEDHIHTAGAVVIHQFCHLGSFSFIGGGSVINQDVPRYMMVSGDRAELRGLNFEGLKRNGFLETEVRSMRKAYRKIFISLGANSDSFDDRLAAVEGDPELSSFTAVRSMTKSIRDSFHPNRRGICKFGHWCGHQAK